MEEDYFLEEGASLLISVILQLVGQECVGLDGMEEVEVGEVVAALFYAVEEAEWVFVVFPLLVIPQQAVGSVFSWCVLEVVEVVCSNFF